MRSQGDYATAIGILVKEKTLWRILEEVTLFWCVACAISATEKVKSHQHRSTSVTGNDCALVKSPLALEMIRLKSAIWEEGSPRLKRLFACWYSGALPLDLFFSAAALETDLYAGVSLVLPVYCKLPCHGRARARVSGLEGGGKGSSSGAVGEGRHSHFLRREKKKRPRLTLSDQLSPHSQLPFSLFGPFARTSDCVSAQEDPVLEAGAVVFFLFIRSGLPVSLISV